MEVDMNRAILLGTVVAGVFVVQILPRPAMAKDLGTGFGNCIITVDLSDGTPVVITPGMSCDDFGANYDGYSYDALCTFLPCEVQQQAPPIPIQVIPPTDPVFVLLD